MSEESGKWPISVVGRIIIEKAIGEFLRTHRDGERLLLAWLDLVPPDRTEAEFKAERDAQREARATYRRRMLEATNEFRAAKGQPPLNERWEPDLTRNKKQSSVAQADQAAVAGVLERSPRVTAKEVLRILGWRGTKLRAVRRHLARLRAR